MQADMDKLKRVMDFFDEGGLLDDIENIKEFRFAVQHAQVSALSRPEFQSVIAGHLSKEISAFVTEQELHQLDALVAQPGEKQIDVFYGDDVYHFATSLNDHIFAVTRHGSGMQEFFEFYRTVMPFIPELYKSTVGVIEGQSPIKISPYLCNYSFKLHLSSFKPAGRGGRQRIPNYELMQRLVDLMPPKDSPFAELNLDQIARTDLTVSAWKEFAGNLRNVWINAQAPENKMWSTLELKFDYRAGTHTDAKGKRSPFPQEMIDEWDIALVDFFRNMILNKFLMAWLKNITFSTNT